MKEKLTASGGVTASVFASICWIGPLLIALLGTGGGALALVAGLAPYRTYFIVITVALLALSWALTIKRKLVFGGNPHPIRVKWMEKREILLIVSTAIAIAVLLFPLYSQVFRRFLGSVP